MNGEDDIDMSSAQEYAEEISISNNEQGSDEDNMIIDEEEDYTFPQVESKVNSSTNQFYTEEDDDDQGEACEEEEDYTFPEVESKANSSTNQSYTEEDDDDQGSSEEDDDKAMWHRYRYYQNHDDYRNYFEPTYYCHSLSKTDRFYPENGDKVIMPISALDSLVHMRVDYPMLFQIKNNHTGKSSHCGVLEFTSEEGSVLLPDWMMKNLELEDGDLVNMKNVSLNKATFLKLQPHKMEFVTSAGDPKALLESTLSSFSCLSAGDTIVINNGNRSYYLNVLETKPGDAVCVNETDCNVDFAPPLNYREKAKVEQPLEKKVKDDAPTSKDDEDKFVPFSGKRYTLTD